LFTSNLISQTSWLKVKLKLVSLEAIIQIIPFPFRDYGYLWIHCRDGSVQQSTHLAEGLNPVYLNFPWMV